MGNFYKFTISSINQIMKSCEEYKTVGTDLKKKISPIQKLFITFVHEYMKPLS